MKKLSIAMVITSSVVFGGCSTADMNAILTGLDQGLSNSGLSNSTNSSNSANSIPQLNCTGGQTVQWHRGEYYCGFSSPSSTNTTSSQPSNSSSAVPKSRGTTGVTIELCPGGIRPVNNRCPEQ